MDMLHKFLKEFMTDDNIARIFANIDTRYNHIQHQYKDSECGVYSIYFITKLLEDKSFDEIINNKIADDEMAEFRAEFFTFR
jgi:hypothetical protein